MIVLIRPEIYFGMRNDVIISCVLPGKIAVISEMDLIVATKYAYSSHHPSQPMGYFQEAHISWNLHPFQMKLQIFFGILFGGQRLYNPHKDLLMFLYIFLLVYL